MLQEPMMEKLLAMRLQGMADALKTQEQDPSTRELSFLERLALLVDHQWNWRQNQALTRRLRVAKLRGNACVEEIDYRAARGLDKSVIRALTQESAWVRNHEHIFVLGPTGVGKSFVASALAQKACRDGYSALYTRAAALFRDLTIARADGSLRLLLAKLSRIDLLVIDDWAMAPLSEPERRDFWEICEDRYQTRSLILTSQLPVARWHEQIGDPTVADGILDRLVHNAHRIEMRGDSMRKKRATSPASWRPPGHCSAERGTGPPSLSPHPFPGLRPAASASLRTVSLDEAEHFLHNQKASVATLRWCSASARNAVRLPFGKAFAFAGILNVSSGSRPPMLLGGTRSAERRLSANASDGE